MSECVVTSLWRSFFRTVCKKQSKKESTRTIKSLGEKACENFESDDPSFL
jgi:hypothetical protein